MKEITKEEALNRLRAMKTYGVKLSDLAARFEVSSSFVSAVLSGQKAMNEQMLEAVGVTRRTIYETNE